MWCYITYYNVVVGCSSTDVQGQIKIFGARRQWKHFRPLFQAVFLSGGGITPQTVKHQASQSQDRNNKNILFYILNFASIIKFKM